VGTSWVVGEGRRAFVRTADGRMLDLNHRVRSAPGWTLQFATGINDAGVIVGYGRSEGRSRAFLLTPACDADYNGDTMVNSADVMAYLNSWTAREAAADFDGDGGIDTRDVIAFLDAWATGC
jgi:hypothetical protein